MNQWKKSLYMLGSCVLLAMLSGCSLVGYFLSGCGSPEADLVFYNDSTAVVGRVEVSTERESQSAINADGTALERGDTWGFELTDEEQELEVAVYSQQDTLLARGSISWPGDGERLWVVYSGRRVLRFQWEAPE